MPTDDMHTARVTKEIDAPIEDVWAVLDDFGNVQEYSPKNKACRLLDGPETGVGARRETELYAGFSVVHEITEYEPERRMRFDHIDVGEFPVKEIHVEFTLNSVGDSRTEVTMAADYRPKWGLIGMVLGKTVLKRKLRGLLEDTLGGLDKHIQTGKRIGEDATPMEAPAV